MHPQYTLETAKATALIELEFSTHGVQDPSQISWYKLDKHSGYSVILLYKNTCQIEATDFMTPRAKEIQSQYPQTMVWNTFGIMNFARLFALSRDIYPFDQRTKSLLKKSVMKDALEELENVSGGWIVITKPPRDSHFKTFKLRKTPDGYQWKGVSKKGSTEEGACESRQDLPYWASEFLDQKDAIANPLPELHGEESEVW